MAEIKKYPKILFRVEYNEDQQSFHLESMNGNHEPYTHGWQTISENADDVEFKGFVKFINYKQNKKYTVKYLQRSYKRYLDFLEYYKYLVKIYSDSDE
jgi:hypothetical protein